jgi:hypothetical protein
MVLIGVAASLLWAGASFAGNGVAHRLDGSFLFEDDEQGDDNEACVIAAGFSFGVEGQVLGSPAASCTVFLRYDTDLPSKVSGTVLKDGSGSAKVSQQVQTRVQLQVIGAGCAETFGPVNAFPEKCKASGSVKADEPSDAVDKAKLKLTCDLGENLSEFGAPSEVVRDEVAAAFEDRKDVTLKDGRHLKIKTKGVPNSGDHSCT